MSAPDQGGNPREHDPATTLKDLAWTIHRRIPEVEGFHPLPTTELAVLNHVMDAPGITVSELARYLGLRQSNASAAVRTLAERGLVVREDSPDDRRVTRIVPTEEAMREHVAVAAAWSGPIEAAIARLTPEDRAAVEAATPALRTLVGLLHRPDGATAGRPRAR